jgi:hypothetical protein
LIEFDLAAKQGFIFSHQLAPAIGRLRFCRVSLILSQSSDPISHLKVLRKAARGSHIDVIRNFIEDAGCKDIGIDQDVLSIDEQFIINAN